MKTPGLDAELECQVHPGLKVGVALQVAPGERLVLFGRSGAGKTTVLRMLAGLRHPNRGWIHLNGRTLVDTRSATQLPLRHRRVGMIFQDDLLFPHMTVRANIAFGLVRLGRGESTVRVEEVAALCGVEHLLDRRPDTLSGGERQRVGLARALAPRPDLLLCDEPLSALDWPARAAMIGRLLAVSNSERIPIVLVTHHAAEAVALGQRMLRMEAGCVVDQGLPLDVLARWAVGDAASSLDDLRNFLPGCVAERSEIRGEMVVQLDGGPELVVPLGPQAIGDRVVVAVRSGDIILSRDSAGRLSARNRLEGRVDRVVTHGAEAEVVVRTGEITWIVSVVAGAVAGLELGPGVPVHLVLKARGCQISEEGRASGSPAQTQK